MGSVLGLTSYSYIYSIDGIQLNNTQTLCLHLKKAENDNRKVKLVTRKRVWEYMSGSKYNLYDVKIKDVKLVGPKVSEGEACNG